MLEYRMTPTAPHTEEKSLRAAVGKFPRASGVYLMKNEAGEVIYVGKAKDLRARVTSYFGAGDGRVQITYLMRKVVTIDKIVTESEYQAFILERDLITKFKPRYNIRLKDDKTYLSVRVDLNQEWPRLELVRRIEEDGARYFGPYGFSYELRALLELIKRVVPLRTCTDTVFHNRQRPCLEYQIKRCCGPCCLPVTREEYVGYVKQAMAILEGRASDLIRDLKQRMKDASLELQFEEAAAIRDRLEVLERLHSEKQMVAHRGENRDVFALYREGSMVVVTLLRVRNGSLADSENFAFEDVQVADEEVLEAAITQLYDKGREVPEELVLSLPLVEQEGVREYLRAKRGSAVDVLVPERGIKARLVGIALTNAKHFFATRFEAERRNEELSRELAKVVGLTQMPRRIECIDISNLQGSDIVAAITSFYDGVPDKERYRRYHVTEQGKPDDFGAIAEVVQRRLERGIQEQDLPDLLIVDGGQGQLRAALAARDALGVKLDIIGLAKIREDERRRFGSDKTPERFFLEGGSEPIVLAEDRPLTHFVQRIRDETHRYVITFHRQRRTKRVLRSGLDGIAGVGPERRRRLLQVFGSVDQLRMATPEAVARAGRMPLPLAEKILRALRT